MYVREGGCGGGARRSSTSISITRIYKYLDRDGGERSEASGRSPLPTTDLQVLCLEGNVGGEAKRGEAASLHHQHSYLDKLTVKIVLVVEGGSEAPPPSPPSTILSSRLIRLGGQSSA